MLASHDSDYSFDVLDFVKARRIDDLGRVLEYLLGQRIQSLALIPITLGQILGYCAFKEPRASLNGIWGFGKGGRARAKRHHTVNPL